jgi:hypothetical protein
LIAGELSIRKALPKANLPNWHAGEDAERLHYLHLECPVLVRANVAEIGGNLQPETESPNSGATYERRGILGAPDTLRRTTQVEVARPQHEPLRRDGYRNARVASGNLSVREEEKAGAEVIVVAIRIN